MSARDVLDRWQALADGATEGPWVSAPGDQRVHAPHLVEQDEATEVADVFDFRRDAEFIAAARTIVPAAVKALRDVSALHVSSSESRGVGRVDPETGQWGAYCDGDGEWWPCPTVQAIEAAIGGEGS